MWGQRGDDLAGSVLTGEKPKHSSGALEPFGEGFVLKTGVFMNHGRAILFPP
jgi:hypothetical protein